MTSLEYEPRFARLRAWFESLGGATHKDVEMYEDPVTGVSLRVRPSASDAVSGMVVSCPAAAMLSYLDATRTQSLPAAFLAAVPPHVVGRFFLVQQYLLGTASHWHAYIATLPPPDDVAAWGLPAVWLTRDAQASAFLRGTNADVAAHVMAGLMADEYDAAVPFLGPDAASYTRDLYAWAHCLFTSRSFRPSLVLPGAPADDFSVLLPVLDLGNHDARAAADWQPYTSASTASSTTTSTSPSHTGVAFCTRDTWAPGAQVFNNYGHKTNSELLVGYGFVLPVTDALHNDYVHLRRAGGGPAVTPSDGAGIEAGGAPPSFLLGLRGMQDTSSVVGRTRARITVGMARLDEFGRFEDGLLLDMLQALCSDTERDRLAAYASASVQAKTGADASVALLQGTILDLVFGDEGDDEDEPGYDAAKEAFLLGKADAVRQALAYKMYTDRKALRRADPATDAADAADSAFARLARQYRAQYCAVIEAAFQSLAGDDGASSDED